MLRRSKKIESFSAGYLQIAITEKHSVIGLKPTIFHFDDKKLRWSQYNNARLNNIDCDRVISIPCSAKIGMQDVLFIEDEFWKIKFIEIKDTLPESKWLFLAKSNFSFRKD